MRNVSNIKDCYGCGICAVACPKKIIEIRLNHLGFYEPSIVHEKKCIDCSICVDVCAFTHNEAENPSNNPKGYASWSRDARVRLAASSGGTGFEIARHLLKKGYLFCGVRYNSESRRVEHFLTKDEIELIQSLGSKYIQSYTLDAFRQFDRHYKYVVTGTPCQIASVRRYIRKRKMEENFLLIDLFCHGVPSMWLWNKYVTKVESKVGRLIMADWRSKFTSWCDFFSMGVGSDLNSEEKPDWHEPYNMQIKGGRGILISRAICGDLFYRFFFGHLCLGRQCVGACRFKMTASAADIRMGDLWGATYQAEDKGVTGILALTEKGQSVITDVNNLYLQPESVSTVCEGQMKENAHNAPMATVAQYMLRGVFSLSAIYYIVYLLQLPYKVINKFKSRCS